MSQFRLSRRAVLRGAAGAAIALPYLEAMGQTATIPKRFLWTFMGSSLGGDGDPSPNQFVPDKKGAGYDLKFALEHLGKAGVAADVSVISGLLLPSGGPTGYPPGSWHCAAQATMFTGQTSGANGNKNNPTGTSPDELLAGSAAFKGKGKFQVLRLRVQAKGYAPGPTPGRDSMSWRDSKKLDMQFSPKAAYDALFYNLPSPMADPLAAAQRDYQLRSRRSVLDLVADSNERLMKRVGRYDAERLQKHLDEIRTFEKRLLEVPSAMAAACRAPDKFDEPAVGSDAPKRSGGGVIVGETGAYSDEDKRAALMTEIMVKALSCELTYIGALMYTMCQSYMSMYQIAGLKSDVHQIGHSGAGRPTTAKVSQVVSWHVKHFAQLVKRLKEERQADGSSLLDHTAVVFMPEGGGGGDSHTGKNYAMLLAGRAGGLKVGQHIALGGDVHPVRVMLTAANAVGGGLSAIGKVSGEIAELKG